LEIIETNVVSETIAVNDMVQCFVYEVQVLD